MGLVEGALILLTGILLGRFLPGRRKAPKLPAPVCGCGHHYSFHDPQTLACGYESAIYLGSGKYGPTCICRCARYAGPEPLPEYVPREIAEG